jgi:sucrose-6-phosphate hydrolase SacC (GH32 family)
MLHWKHLPLALGEENGVMIVSGSAVVDHHSTSGFGKDSQLPLVAIYTGQTRAKQTQDIAYSTDRGRTWTKFASNPVIDQTLKDFRDRRCSGTSRRNNG